MTISFFVECNDCYEKYRIRYGVGNSYPQLASFQCDKCSKQIETGIDKLNGDKVLRGATEFNNTDLLDPTIKVQNLHPEIPTLKGNQNDPFHFQTMDIFKNVFESKTKLADFRAQQILWAKFNSKWIVIEKSLRILSTKDEIRLKEISGMNFRDFTKEFNDWIEIFISGEQESSFENICEEYNSINLTNIKDFVKNEKKFLKQINELCNTYMKQAQQFQTTIFHQKFNWEINDDMIANINWNEICTIYGDLYEIVGDFFVIPSLMNNIRNGRNFEQFQTPDFTLSKYIKTDKANRANNFQSNPNLSFLSNAYHSWLRNGTHHKNSFLNQKTYEIELGISKGGTVEKKISIIEYIKNCNELFGIGLILSSLILEMKK